ncbi:uncharacterized protein LOC141622664 [Silene latifolia]|uniref:uncharacterized protein LOC141622664 n=1 Tax=Silene latifolia TaxID=37657 RepID=UPI003D7700DE
MDDDQQSSSSSDHNTHWIKIQDELKKRLIENDEFTWELPSSSSSSCSVNTKEILKYIGGVDISFVKEDPRIACGTLVVLEIPSLNVVYHDFSLTNLDIPYIPGFLAFREVPVLLKLIQKMKADAQANRFYPQLLMVDGNGSLHPRGFGLACHLGVLADLPTIGVAKNLHHVQGLNRSKISENDETVFLIGNAGRTLGAAVKSTLGSVKPIFVSVGHRMSLNTALKIVEMTCKYRIPEPIRQADIRSREYLRNNHVIVSTTTPISDA